MPTHIEQPASRQSKPASVNTCVQSFGLGLALHQARARHDQARTCGGSRCAEGALEHGGGGAQVLDAAVGAASR
jgi:hypothetical protein